MLFIVLLFFFFCYTCVKPRLDQLPDRLPVTNVFPEHRATTRLFLSVWETVCFDRIVPCRQDYWNQWFFAKKGFSMRVPSMSLSLALLHVLIRLFICLCWHDGCVVELCKLRELRKWTSLWLKIMSTISLCVSLSNFTTPLMLVDFRLIRNPNSVLSNFPLISSPLCQGAAILCFHDYLDSVVSAKFCSFLQCLWWRRERERAVMSGDIFIFPCLCLCSYLCFGTHRSTHGGGFICI